MGRGQKGRTKAARLRGAAALAAALTLSVVSTSALSQDAAVSGFEAPSVGDAGAEVVLRALSLLGVPYKFGGNTPETGLDCSGLVRWAFDEALGLPLPRRSEEISRVGAAIAPTELQPGDLVFFNTLRRAFSHVGIYIGNNRFVHAPSSGRAIRVESLGANYWTSRFDGARRLVTQDLLAAASMNPVAASAARAGQAAARSPNRHATSVTQAGRPTQLGPRASAAQEHVGARAARATANPTAQRLASRSGIGDPYIH
jgi:uncharacterized protein YycO